MATLNVTPSKPDPAELAHLLADELFDLHAMLEAAAAHIENIPRASPEVEHVAHAAMRIVNRANRALYQIAEMLPDSRVDVGDNPVAWATARRLQPQA